MIKLISDFLINLCISIACYIIIFLLVNFLLNTNKMSEENQNIDPNLDPNQQIEVAAAAIKLPPFWKNNPALWFCQVESQFDIAGIRTDVTKFNYIVGKMESNVLSQVSDIILNRPQADLYTTLKNRILQCFTESAESKFKRLIDEISLDGKKPSNLLREMRELAGTGVGNDVLKSLWLKRLPIQVQTVLAVSDENLPKLAEMADKVIEVSSGPNVCSVDSGRNVDLNGLFEQMEIMRSEISELRKLRTNNEQRDSRSFQNRSRSRSKSGNRGGLCFYHYKFKEKAHKCVRPCSYHASASVSDCASSSNQGNR